MIEKINKGVYGYRTKAKIPRIANGYGIPISGKLTIGKKWTYKGQKHSYVNARCETGHLQARVEATFKTATSSAASSSGPARSAASAEALSDA